MAKRLDFSRAIEFVEPCTIVVGTDYGYEVIICSNKELINIKKKYRRYLINRDEVLPCECRNKYGVYDYDIELAVRRKWNVK